MSTRPQALWERGPKDVLCELVPARLECPIPARRSGAGTALIDPVRRCLRSSMELSPGPGTFPICVSSFIGRSIVWDSSCMHMNLQMADYGLPRYTSVHSGQYVRSRDTGDRSTRRSPTRLLLLTTWCVWAYNSAVHSSILDRVLTCHQFDPATPFANAQRVADLLGQSAVLVRQNGFGVSPVSMDSV